MCMACGVSLGGFALKLDQRGTCTYACMQLCALHMWHSADLGLNISDILVNLSVVYK